MARIDYLNDPNAPKANSIKPAASAIVTDGEGRILLHRRSDNLLWSLPGGTMELGESIKETVKREVLEETGLLVEPISVVGIYTNPCHLIAYDDGEVRQEFSICFACKTIGGTLKASEESLDIRYFAKAELETLPIHQTNRQRIQDYYNDIQQSPGVNTL